MGTFGDGDNSKKKSRGASNVGKKLEGFGKAQGAAGTCDWGEAMPENISAVVLGITRIGGAVSFGLSRDKGAYNVTLMLEGERRTVWINGNEPLDEKLTEIIIQLDGIS